MRRLLGWRILAGLGVLSAILFFTVGAGAAGFHGIAYVESCNGTTKIGDPYVCSYQILNIADSAHDTLRVTSIVDRVNSAAGIQTSGNILHDGELVFGVFSGSPPPASCTGGSGLGTDASPYINATSCDLPFGTKITVKPFSFYTVTAADYAQNANHTISDQSTLTWSDICDFDVAPKNCPIGNHFGVHGRPDDDSEALVGDGHGDPQRGSPSGDDRWRRHDRARQGDRDRRGRQADSDRERHVRLVPERRLLRRSGSRTRARSGRSSAPERRRSSTRPRSRSPSTRRASARSRRITSATAPTTARMVRVSRCRSWTRTSRSRRRTTPTRSAPTTCSRSPSTRSNGTLDAGPHTATAAIMSGPGSFVGPATCTTRVARRRRAAR